MLSEEEKSKIRADEELRLTIRNQSCCKQSRSKKCIAASIAIGIGLILLVSMACRHHSQFQHYHYGTPQVQQQNQVQP